MRNYLALGTTALALCLAAPAAATDFLISVGPGTSSTDFGATATSSGTLDDRFIFTVPAGSVNGFVGSIALTELLDVDLDDVRLDDTPFTQILSDGTEFWTLSPLLLAPGTHSIHLVGSWGETGGSYAGTLNFAPGQTGAIPEPAAWMMMVSGFGLLGAALRRRRPDRITFAR